MLVGAWTYVRVVAFGHLVWEPRLCGAEELKVFLLESLCFLVAVLRRVSTRTSQRAEMRLLLLESLPLAVMFKLVRRFEFDVQLTVVVGLFELLLSLQNLFELVHGDGVLLQIVLAWTWHFGRCPWATPTFRRAKASGNRARLDEVVLWIVVRRTQFLLFLSLYKLWFRRLTRFYSSVLALRFCGVKTSSCFLSFVQFSPIDLSRDQRLLGVWIVLEV